MKNEAHFLHVALRHIACDRSGPTAPTTMSAAAAPFFTQTRRWRIFVALCVALSGAAFVEMAVNGHHRPLLSRALVAPPPSSDHREDGAAAMPPLVY